MTENEAIYCLKAGSERHSEVCEECSLYGKVGCDHCYDDATDKAIQALEKVQAFEAIGTIDEFKALKEKATPMKPIPNKPLEEGRLICWSCPNCGKENWNGYYFPPLTFDKVCTDCFQVIDWQ